MSFLDSFGGMSNAVPINWADFQSQVQASETFDQWMAEQQAAAERNGGDAGTVIRPDDYATSINYTLPGKQGNWTWDGGQYIQPDTPDHSWVTAGVTPVNVVHDDGTGNGNGTGVYYGKTSFDNSPTGFDRFLDIAMPLAVGAITGIAGGAALGGWMGAGEGAGVLEGADGLTTGIGEGAYDTAAAPTFTYGETSPWAWSQSGGADLGTGFYGTDPMSMAGTFGTTAGGATGEVGSALGTGIAADGGAWAGAGGGWGAMLDGAGAAGGYGLGDAFSTAKDVYKYGNDALKLYNLLNPPSSGGSGALGGPTGGFANYGGGSGTGGLAQALAAVSGKHVGAAGEAPYTDMTSEVAQIPMVNQYMASLQQPNNTLPKSKDGAMINGSGLGALSSL